MADSGESKQVSQAVQTHVDEIIERRKAARALRAQALERHPRPISFKTEMTAPALAAAAPVTSTQTSQTAGYLLAVGDSWFDYPIHDVLTKLEDHYGYNVESSAHRGDPIETMVSHVGQLDKFSRCIDKVIGHGAKPKAILISGGGDDIAGDEFGMLINNIDLTTPGLNDDIVRGVIEGRIAIAYRMMFAKVNALCQQQLGATFPILVHGYDYPVPDGRGFLGGWGPLPGPWLKPGFDEKLYTNLDATIQMMCTLIDRFNAMLQNLVKEPGFEMVHYVDLRNTLSHAISDYKDWWANELHPTGGGLFGGKDGFLAVAEKFEVVLAALP